MIETDVFIVGAGPAGLAAALAARKHGLSVVVADGSRPPIDKACGEGLMPDSQAAAARLGIELDPTVGHHFRGIRFLNRHRSVKADFPDGPGIGIRRVTLHSLLIDAAERAHVDLRWATPISDFDRIEARWIVGADGSASRVRRWAALDPSFGSTRRYAFRQHYAIAPWTNYMEVYWGDGCQVYITPIGEREVCVAMMSRTPNLRLAEALRQFPVLQDRLSGVLVSSRERGAITSTMRLSNVARGNIALIGDASGSVDAITGEGLCLSFRQAELLAQAIAEGSLARYNRMHPRISFRPHLMARTMLLLDRGPSIRRAAIGTLSAQPWIFERLLALHVA